MAEIDLKALTTGALSFTVALAWNQAVSTTINSLFPRNPKVALIVYAVVITLLVFAIAFVIGHVSRKFTPNTFIPAGEPQPQSPVKIKW